MFRNSYQAGFLSVLYSIGSKPLQLWDTQVQNGHINRITDEDIQSSVLELVGANVLTSYITCPADPKRALGIKLPFLVMIVKNMNKYFSFEVTIIDDKNVRRRFRASNYQSATAVKPFICTMPMRLDEGWNQIQFNLADFTRRAYGTNYVETIRVQIHANCRIRRIYFADRLYSEEELPNEFKLYLPSAVNNAEKNVQSQAVKERRNIAAAAQKAKVGGKKEILTKAKIVEIKPEDIIKSVAVEQAPVEAVENSTQRDTHIVENAETLQVVATVAPTTTEAPVVAEVAHEQDPVVEPAAVQEAAPSVTV